jgi:L,D-transpeptidase YcbB
MRIARFDHLMAGSTALALTLALTSYSGSALGQSAAAATAPMPAPASAGQPPEAAKEAAPVKGEVTSSIPESGDKSTPSADTATIEKLRELLASGKADRMLGGRQERTAIEAFYETRGFAPLWIAGNALSDRGKAAASYLAGIDAHGLEPSEYPLPKVSAGADPAALAEAELDFTNAVMTFARHALTGRVHYSRVAGDIEYKLERPEPKDVLGQLAGLAPVADVLESFHPQHPGYKALKAKLAEVRARKDEAKQERIPDGQLLRYRRDAKGAEILMQDPRVPLIRKRLGVEGDLSNTTYDKELADAVTKFQKDQGIRVTSVVGPQTIAALNGPNRERDADIIVANLERWRWMPRDLGRIHVVLNVPDFSLRVMRDEKLVWQTRVVVGKPSQATPMMSAEMRSSRSTRPGTCRRRSSRTNTCRPCSKTRACWSASASRSRRRLTAPYACGSRRAIATRSAASVSTSRTASWSISTTRRTSTCSSMSVAPTATAACGSRTR